MTAQAPSRSPGLGGLRGPFSGSGRWVRGLCPWASPMWHRSGVRGRAGGPKRPFSALPHGHVPCGPRALWSTCPGVRRRSRCPPVVLWALRSSEPTFSQKHHRQVSLLESLTLGAGDGTASWPCFLQRVASWGAGARPGLVSRSRRGLRECPPAVARPAGPEVSPAVFMDHSEEEAFAFQIVGLLPTDPWRSVPSRERG